MALLLGAQLAEGVNGVTQLPSQPPPRAFQLVPLPPGGRQVRLLGLG